MNITDIRSQRFRFIVYIFTNFILFAAWIYLARNHWIVYKIDPRPYILFYVITESLVAVMFLIRQEAKTITKRPFDWFICGLAVIIPFLFRPVSNAIYYNLGTGMIIIGSVIHILSLLSLRRSMGIMPANRGVVTVGIYRLVRHPMYLSYILVYTGYILISASWHNILIYVVTVILMMFRIILEERHLYADPVYRDYVRSVRRKLVPYF